MEAFTKGATFASFDSFNSSLDQISKLQNVQFVIAHSKTVKSCNKSLRLKGQRLFNDDLIYQHATFGCKHSGTLKSQGKGIRPIQRSFKSECPAHVTIGASVKTQSIKITSISLKHNHDLSELAFKHYPEQRRIKGDYLAVLHQLDEYGVKPVKLRDIIHKASDKIITRKDLCNIRAKHKKSVGQSDLEQVLEELKQLQGQDPDASVQVGNNESGLVKVVFFQTGAMKATFRRFPEVLLMDATYCVNAYSMPLIVFMCMDGFGNGRVAAYCIVADERQNTVRAAIEIFCKYNPIALTKTRTVVIDKDYNEITLITDLLPNVHIHLCAYHVEKVFRAETQSEPLKNEVRELLAKILYVGDPDAYDTIYTELCAVASQRFITYFNKNWHNCQQSWTNYDRTTSIDLGNRTTNRVESHNQKIKTVLTRHNSLAEAIKGLLLLERSKLIAVQHEQFESQFKTTYVPPNCQSTDINNVLRSVTPFSASIILKQIEASMKLGSVEHTGAGLLVGKARKLYEVTTEKCNCTLAQSMLLPCRHIFYVRRGNGLSIFEKSLVGPRWTIAYNTSADVTRPVTQASSQPICIEKIAEKKKATSVQDRYSQAKPIALEVCRVLSTSCDIKYERRLAQLELLKTFWSLDQELTITSHVRTTRHDVLGLPSCEDAEKNCADAVGEMSSSADKAEVSDAAQDSSTIVVEEDPYIPVSTPMRVQRDLPTYTPVSTPMRVQRDLPTYTPISKKTLDQLDLASTGQSYDSSTTEAKTARKIELLMLDFDTQIKDLTKQIDELKKKSHAPKHSSNMPGFRALDNSGDKDVLPPEVNRILALSKRHIVRGNQKGVATTVIGTHRRHRKVTRPVNANLAELAPRLRANHDVPTHHDLNLIVSKPAVEEIQSKGGSVEALHDSNVQFEEQKSSEEQTELMQEPKHTSIMNPASVLTISSRLSSVDETESSRVNLEDADADDPDDDLSVPEDADADDSDDELSMPGEWEKPISNSVLEPEDFNSPLYNGYLFHLTKDDLKREIQRIIPVLRSTGKPNGFLSKRDEIWHTPNNKRSVFNKLLSSFRPFSMNQHEFIRKLLAVEFCKTTNYRCFDWKPEQIGDQYFNSVTHPDGLMLMYMNIMQVSEDLANEMLENLEADLSLKVRTRQYPFTENDYDIYDWEWIRCNSHNSDLSDSDDDYNFVTGPVSKRPKSSGPHNNNFLGVDTKVSEEVKIPEETLHVRNTLDISGSGEQEQSLARGSFVQAAVGEMDHIASPLPLNATVRHPAALPNGLLYDHEYYLNNNIGRNFLVALYGNTQLFYEDYRLLSLNECLNSFLIDSCAAALKSLYPQDSMMYVSIQITAFIFSYTKSLCSTFTMFKKKISHFHNILMPYNADGNHWCLVRAEMQSKTLYHYDSLPSPHRPGKCLSKFTAFLEERNKYNGLDCIDATGWKVEVWNVAKQVGIVDCGVHVLYFMKCILSQKRISSFNTAVFRKELACMCLSQSDSVVNVCLYCGRKGHTEWICCDMCSRWVHYNCIGTKDIAYEAFHLVEFTCELCKN